MTTFGMHQQGSRGSSGAPKGLSGPSCSAPFISPLFLPLLWLTTGLLSSHHS